MRLRLQAKYTLMLGAVVLAVAGVLTVMFARTLHTTTEEMAQTSIRDGYAARMRQVEMRGRDIVHTMATGMSHHMQSREDGLVSHIARTVRTYDGVAAVRVYDPQGRTIADGTAEGQARGIPAPLDIATTTLARKTWFVRQDESATTIAAPILQHGRLLGAVSLQLSHGGFKTEFKQRHEMLEQVARDNNDRTITYLVLFIGVFIFAVIILGNLAARRMSLPIEQLREAVNRIAKGRFEINWPARRADEIGELSNGLRKMVSQLRTKTVSVAYLDDIISSMFDCLVVTDSRQRIEMVNTATCRLTGYSPHDLVNQPFAKLLLPPGSLAMQSPYQSDAADNAQLMTDMIYSKAGKIIPVQMSTTVMASHVDGRPRRVCMFRDVSEQQAREEELRQAKEEAEIANASKSQFLANMSHELRTPLNAVIGFSSMIKDEIKGPLSDTYRSYARDIHDSAQHLLAIINDILDISKLEAGKMELYDEDVNVAEVVFATLRLVRTKADEQRITLEAAIPPDLPDICADQRMLKQMLLNLLSNAVKFNHPDGKVEVRAKVEADGALTITVTDTGIGMDPANIPRLLEPFSQADSALNRTYEGTGLGLAITKSMAELHGGNLIIDSAVDGGTSITIELPPARVSTRDINLSATS